MKAQIILGDCIEKMQSLVKEGFKCEAIIIDPPYLLLNHKMDKKFDEKVFLELAAKITDKIVFFGRGDSFFRLNLLAGEVGFEFKEEIVWEKEKTTNSTNFLGRKHELISIRMKKGKSINKVYISYIKERLRKNNLAYMQDDIRTLLSMIERKQSPSLFKEISKMQRVIKRRSKYNITSNISEELEKAEKIKKTIEKGFLLKSIVKINREFYSYKHPTQKPIELMRLLVKLVSNENDLILDTFCGSGTTGLAAMLENRSFLGFEIDEEYFKIAQNRLNEMVKSKSLFDELQSS